MKIQLNKKPKWEYSVGELFQATDTDLMFSVGVFHNSETGKYEPITDKKDPNENVTFVIDKTYVEKKYSSRYLSMRSETEPDLPTMLADFTKLWLQYKTLHKYSWSNHLALTLNYYDPLYNYDRYEDINSNDTTTYNGSEKDKTTFSGSESDTTTYSGTETDTTTYSGKETDTTTYAGSEKNSMKYKGSETEELRKAGQEQIGNTTHNMNRNVGREINQKDVTGYNDADNFTPESRDITSYDATRNPQGQAIDLVNKSEIHMVTDVDDEGLVNTTMLDSTGNAVSGRITEDNGINLETHSYNHRVDKNKKSYSTDREDVNEITYTNRTDTNSKEFNNRQDSAVKSFSNREDARTHTFNNRENETERSFENRNDSTVTTANNHMYGNIGVATTMSLVMEQYQLNELYDFAIKVFSDFVNEFTIVM